MEKIVKSFSKIIIPFYFSEAQVEMFEKKLVQIKTKNIILWELYEFSSNHLLTFVNDKLGKKENSIGRSYGFVYYRLSYFFIAFKKYSHKSGHYFKSSFILTIKMLRYTY